MDETIRILAEELKIKDEIISKYEGVYLTKNIRIEKLENCLSELKSQLLDTNAADSVIILIIDNALKNEL